jgi:hypothetical protein
MTFSSLFAVVLLLTLAGLSMADAAQGAPAPTEYIQVEIKGKLKTGLVAIGGETTGTVIVAKGATWELDFAGNAELQKLAGTLGGKTVIVKGSYEVRAGVEIKQRHIVTVTSLKEAG